MGRPERPVFPLFRSEIYADVAFQVFHSPVPLSVKDLVELVNASRFTVGGIVEELVEAGILHDRRVGSTRQLTARADAPFYEPLLQLLTIVVGPQAVIGDALEGMDVVSGALIYGSWAARAQGVRGSSPRDIDVLILSGSRLGSRDRVAIRDRLEDAEQALRREVNPIFATLTQWRDSEDPFLHNVRSSPLVEAVPLRS